MSMPILATKLYIPSLRPKVVLRSHLIERLNEGTSAGRTPGVTLISAPAGFGKTTLVSEWIAGPWHRPPHRPDTLARGACLAYTGGQVCNQQSQPKGGAAWLSLDEGDNDLARFLIYLVAALRTVARNIGGLSIWK